MIRPLIKSKLLVRFATYAIAIALIVLLLTQLTTSWLRNFSEKERRRANVGPFAVVTALLNGVPPADRARILTRIRANDPRDFVANAITLYDQDRRPLYPAADVRSADAAAEFVALEGQPRQYVTHSPPPDRPGPPGEPPPMGGPGLSPFAGIFVIQTIALFAAVLLTVTVLLWSLRAKAQMAERVIADLRRGDLKARFAIGPADEIGQVMISFNRMADEIERLVESLRKTEASRRNLLRELAHDLRTPIASLQSAIETVHEHAERLDPERRRDLLSTALRETTYFASLVEDLLFLGRVDEPGYRTKVERFDVAALVEDEARQVARAHPDKRIRIDVASATIVDGDCQLYRRLIRNACDNAFSFANTGVEVGVATVGTASEITIADDGPGFGEDALRAFGQKKFSREVQGGGPGARISVGLGSVIMKSIVEAHRGRIEVRNRVGPNESGALVEITLPVPSSVNV